MTRLEEIISRQNEYLRKWGGPYAFREADDTYNDMNREQIAAFKEQHGTAYLGNVNFYDKEYGAIVAGEKSVYEEYTGQMVYNFGCSFCIPVADEKLEGMIRHWNSPNGDIRSLREVEAITQRVVDIGGINFIWY